MTKENNKNSGIKPLIEKVLSAEEQKALTPDMVIEALKEGNRRFVANRLTARDHSALFRDPAAGQHPKAFVLSCIDSRVTVVDIFDKGLGELFISRVAGNIVNEDLLGSMEFGCKIVGAKLILVLGHESCSAVKYAIDKVEFGNITSLFSKIKPAIEMEKKYHGEQSSKNPEYLKRIAINNVMLSIEKIRKESPILKEMEENGEIKIVGAYYSLHSGTVTFL